MAANLGHRETAGLRELPDPSVAERPIRPDRRWEVGFYPLAVDQTLLSRELLLFGPVVDAAGQSLDERVRPEDRAPGAFPG